MAAMKQLGNAGHEPFTVTQIEGGVEKTYSLLPGETLTVPLSDSETTQQQTDVTAGQNTAAAATSAAWVELRMIRDRWLDQCQVIFDEIKTPGSQDLSQPMLTGITANSAAWITWRQAMRDLPAKVTDPAAAASAIRSVHATTDTWPAPWPQPPGAPVKHLT